MTTVLVTGGGGYIGSMLTESLLDAGHRVRVVDRFFFGRDLIGNLEDREALEVIRDDVRFLKEEHFAGTDAVVHLAGISNDPACDLDPRISHEVNLEATVRAARLAREAGAKRFLFASSCSIYGQGEEEILDEESPKAPVSLYARSKIDAEEQLAELNGPEMAVTYLRNATVYGLSRRMRFDLVINIMTLYAYKNRKVFVTGGGKQWRPLIHVKDVCRAFMLALDSPVELVAGQAFNVGSNDQNYQIYAIAQMVRDVVPNTSLELVPDDPDKRSYHVSFDKINKVLGFQAMVTPYEGIVEIKQALERGKTEDTIQTKTVHYYRYLLEAERLLKEISYEGKVF